MVDNSSCTFCVFGGFKQRCEVNEDSITQTFYHLSSSYRIVSLERLVCFSVQNIFWNVFLTFWCHFLCSTKTIHHLLLIWNLHLIVHAVVWYFFFHVFPGFEETPAELHSAVRKRNWQAFLKMMLASNCRRWRMKPCACVVLCFSIVRGMQMSKKQEHFSSLKIKKDSVLVFQRDWNGTLKKLYCCTFSS